MKTAGYSGTPLSKKLGLKPGFKIKLINAPDYYYTLLTDLPTDLKEIKSPKIKKDLIHYFANDAAQLNKDIEQLKNEIEVNGMIWISWYKKSAKMKTDLDENTIRDIALNKGLVDVKVCAVDEKWSALKLVIPLKDRK
jgi:hypothetical protein